MFVFQCSNNRRSYHYGDLRAALSGQLYQADTTVHQVFHAAVEAPNGKDWFLQSMAQDACQTQLHKHTHVLIKISTFEVNQQRQI